MDLRVAYAFVAIIAVLTFSNAAFAGPDCDHPNFYVKGCDYEELRGERGESGVLGERGPAGIPGETGPQGAPGRDGRDGIDGADGRDGRDGLDGLSKQARDFRHYVNASNAIQIHLPRTERNRLTLGGTGGNSDVAVGLGYARRLDDSVDFTAGLGRSAGAVVFQLGVSGEF